MTTHVTSAMAQIAFGDEAVPVDRLLSPRGFNTLVKATQENRYLSSVTSNAASLTNEQLCALASNLAPLWDTGRQLFESVWASARPGKEEEGKRVFAEEYQAQKAGKPPSTYEELQSLGYELDGEDPSGNPANNVIRARRKLDLEERGYWFDEKGKMGFNANVFVSYLLQNRALIVECNKSYYIWDSACFWREISEKNIKKLARVVVHEAKRNVWYSAQGDEIMEVLSLHVAQVPEMDRRRDAINLTNCMLDPLNRATLEHSSDHLSTVQLGFAYAPDARCPVFDQFISEVMLGDQELIQLVQEIMGYLLTSDVRMQKAFFFYGEGSNGKSVLAEVIRHLCGLRNVSNTPLKRLEGRFGMQNLPNKTVNISTENELNGREISTEAFKSIVGGDAVNIERKFRESYSAKLFVRLVVLMNNLPQTRDQSHGYFRRIQFVPFRRTFQESEADKTLLGKLLQELPGILNFALEGLHRLAANDYTLTEAKAAQEVHAAYQEDQNPFIDFCRDVLTPEQGAAITRADLQKVFSAWCLANGLTDWAGLQSQRFWALFRTATAQFGLVFDEKKIQGVRHVVDLRVTFVAPDYDMVLTF